MRAQEICLSLILLAAAHPALADKSVELGEYDRHDVRVTTICTEGHVVVIAHSDVGKGGGLDMMQLQQELNGRIAPMRCDEEGVKISQQANTEPADAGLAQVTREKPPGGR